ncbi:hypothetical protein AB0G35_23950 [Streptomyces sp. NPDC021749]|uniref:hypothetical protein n=1 Tax=Streptomyces sp. NPDC021749 TaxID=3154905 RepID=UPI00340103E8
MSTTRPPVRSKAALPLDEDEVRVTTAQRRLIALGAALVTTPFDTSVHQRLLRFLSQDIGAVLASLRTLQQRPEAQLRARIAELTPVSASVTVAGRHR